MTPSKNILTVRIVTPARAYVVLRCSIRACILSGSAAKPGETVIATDGLTVSGPRSARAASAASSVAPTDASR